MKFFTFSFNMIVATLVIGIISAAASTGADVQYGATDVCRLANSLNSVLLAYQKIGQSDTVEVRCTINYDT